MILCSWVLMCEVKRLFRVVFMILMLVVLGMFVRGLGVMMVRVVCGVLGLLMSMVWVVMGWVGGSGVVGVVLLLGF